MIYHKYLPNSFCNVLLSKVLGKTIWIDCYLAGDGKEVSHGYLENDMFKISFSIDLPIDVEVSSELPEVITLRATNSWIALKPTNKYLAFDSRKIPFRKTTGTVEKILTYFDKYVKRLYDIVVEECNNNNIAPQFETLVKEKI